VYDVQSEATGMQPSEREIQEYRRMSINSSALVSTPSYHIRDAFKQGAVGVHVGGTRSGSVVSSSECKIYMAWLADWFYLSRCFADQGGLSNVIN
jgi:hypothetical protein